MGKSDIEWTEDVWNPVRGCKLVSQGCTNCYAMKQAHRFSGPGGKYEGLTRLRTRGGPVWTGEFREVPEKLDEPLHRKKPTTYFVNSMSDAFGEGVSDEFIAAIFGVMAACSQHVFQLLTKRAERLPKWFDWARSYTVELDGVVSPPLHPYVILDDCLGRVRTDLEKTILCAAKRMLNSGHVGSLLWPLPNVHLGVSVEHPDCVSRIDELRKTPAAVRWVSFEPLLADIGHVDLTDIHWIVIGGESGNGARKCDVQWIRKLVHCATEQSVAVFVKQLGAKPFSSVGDIPQHRAHIGQGGIWMLEDRKGGDMREWPEDLRIREAAPRSAQ